MDKIPHPARAARIILAKVGIIGCTVGAWISYHKGPDFMGYYLMFIFLAATAFLVLINDVSKGDKDDDDQTPTYRLRH